MLGHNSAKVAELVDALDLGSSGATRAGSIPVFRTSKINKLVSCCILKNFPEFSMKLRADSAFYLRCPVRVELIVIDSVRGIEERYDLQLSRLDVTEAAYITTHARAAQWQITRGIQKPYGLIEVSSEANAV